MSDRTTQAGSDDRSGGVLIGPVGFAALLVVELLGVSILYNNAFVFECRAAAPAWFCAGLSGAVPRAIAACAIVALVAAARPALGRALAQGLRATAPRRWVLANLAGFGLVMAPWTFLADGAGPAALLAAAALWLAGGALAGAGALLGLFDPAALRRAAAAAPLPLAVGLVVALFAPEIAARLQAIWLWSPITIATFRSAEALLLLLGQPVSSAPERVELWVGGFGVQVGPQCSGVEGVVLITAFLGFYLTLFRQRLRFPHALVLLPIAVAASWTLNVARIVALVLIGAHVSPDLAVNGFHSHAGWLMFSILAVGVTLAAHATPWLRRATEPAVAAPRRAPPPPLREDWNAARLLPFVAFMASALLASTFFTAPGVAYPARFAAVVAALALFAPLYRALPWRLDPVALAAGAAIGLLWIATDPGPDDGSTALMAALAAAPGWFVALWIVTRTLGTTLAVPLLEELLFRDYLLKRLDFGGLAGVVFAVVVSTALFAALHGRWAAAAAAGLVFAIIALRRGGVVGATQAHVAANGVIAAAALATGGWHLI